MPIDWMRSLHEHRTGKRKMLMEEKKMPNPSVMMQAKYDRLEAIKTMMLNPFWGKRAKEMWLREIRQLEKELEIPEDQCTKGYNKCTS